MPPRAASAAIEIHTTGLGFLPPADDPRFAEHRAAAQAGLRKAAEIVAGGRFPLVVLDEDLPGRRPRTAGRAASGGTPRPGPAGDVPGAHRPRGATPALIALADTVTEMRCVKHGLQAGIAAQKGVER